MYFSMLIIYFSTLLFINLVICAFIYIHIIQFTIISDLQSSHYNFQLKLN